MVRHTYFNGLYAKINWDQGYKSDLSDSSAVSYFLEIFFFFLPESYITFIIKSNIHEKMICELRRVLQTLGVSFILRRYLALIKCLLNDVMTNKELQRWERLIAPLPALDSAVTYSKDVARKTGTFFQDHGQSTRSPISPLCLMSQSGGSNLPRVIYLLWI